MQLAHDKAWHSEDPSSILDLLLRTKNKEFDTVDMLICRRLPKYKRSVNHFEMSLENLCSNTNIPWKVTCFEIHEESYL